MLLFETDRLRVKRFTSEDADLFFRINGSPEVMKYIRPAKSREECDLFLKENINLYQNASVVGRYAVFEKSTGIFTGSFSFLYMSGMDEIHIGYALVPEAWGKGFATELVLKGIAYFFAHTAKTVLFAITQSDNRVSQKVLLKGGLLPKGQLLEQDNLLDIFEISREWFETRSAANGA